MCDIIRHTTLLVITTACTVYNYKQVGTPYAPYRDMTSNLVIGKGHHRLYMDYSYHKSQKSVTKTVYFFRVGVPITRLQAWYVGVGTYIKIT